MLYTGTAIAVVPVNKWGIIMIENYMVCNCMQVRYSDISDALHNFTKFDDVLSSFKTVQEVTNCSTGCGGCHQKVLDVISEIMSGATA